MPKETRKHSINGSKALSTRMWVLLKMDFFFQATSFKNSLYTPTVSKNNVSKVTVKRNFLKILHPGSCIFCNLKIHLRVNGRPNRIEKATFAKKNSHACVDKA